MNPIQDPDGNPNRPAAGVELCHADEVAPGKIRRFRFGPYETGFRGLLVQAGGEVKGYIDWCPHWGLQLQDERDDIVVQEGLIVCAWHWARFSPADGKSVDGPGYEGLHPWPVQVGEDGIVRTA